MNTILDKEKMLYDALASKTSGRYPKIQTPFLHNFIIHGAFFLCKLHR